MADDKKEFLMPEEILVQEIFDEYDPQIEECSKRLEAITYSKPKLELKPSWADPQRFTEKPETKEALEKEIDRLKRVAKNKAQQVLEKSPAALKPKLDDRIERWQNPDFRAAADKKTIEQTEASLSRAQRMRGYQKEAAEAKETIQPTSPEMTVKETVSELPQSNYEKRLRLNDMDMQAPEEPGKSEIEPEEPVIDPGED